MLCLLSSIRRARITLKWQNRGFNESPWGPEIYWNIFSLVARSTFSLTRCQISKSKLPSSGNQGLHSTTVWRQASISWRKTEGPWTLNRLWSREEKWGGFPADWPVLILTGLSGPWGHSVRICHGNRFLFGHHLLGSLNGLEPGGLESMIRKRKKERG